MSLATGLAIGMMNTSSERKRIVTAVGEELQRQWDAHENPEVRAVIGEIAERVREIAGQD